MKVQSWLAGIGWTAVIFGVIFSLRALFGEGENTLLLIAAFDGGVLGGLLLLGFAKVITLIEEHVNRQEELLVEIKGFARNISQNTKS